MPIDPWKFVFGLLILAGFGLIYLFSSTDQDDYAWNRFVVDRHCVSVGSQAGNNQSGWRCDDGKIHYRWRQQK